MRLLPYYLVLWGIRCSVTKPGVNVWRRHLPSHSHIFKQPFSLLAHRSYMETASSLFMLKVTLPKIREPLCAIDQENGNTLGPNIWHIFTDPDYFFCAFFNPVLPNIYIVSFNTSPNILTEKKLSHYSWTPPCSDSISSTQNTKLCPLCNFISHCL